MEVEGAGIIVAAGADACADAWEEDAPLRDELLLLPQAANAVTQSAAIRMERYRGLRRLLRETES